MLICHRFSGKGMSNMSDENETNFLNINSVESITEEQLLNTTFTVFHREAEYDSGVNKFRDQLYRYYFGENYTPEDFETDIHDPRQINITKYYLSERLNLIKTEATSLDLKKINTAIDAMFNLIGLTINIPASVEESYDMIFAKRAGHNKILVDTYEVLKINRKIHNIHTGNTDISELSNYISVMEELYSDGAVNREQMAKFYYNISKIYDAECLKRYSAPELFRQQYRSAQYKKKALDMTESNIIMVNDISEDWNNLTLYDGLKILEACLRIIDNNDTTNRDKYKAHKLYADTLLRPNKVKGFCADGKNLETALYHYNSSLRYASQPTEQLEILNKVAKAQQKNFPEDYIKTRLKIAELLEGRSRIREYESIAPFTEPELQTNILKAAINEFHELNQITPDDSILYNRIDAKLRNLLPEDTDKRTLATLDRMKKKFGKYNETKQKNELSIKSSQGHNYFKKGKENS